MPQVLKEAVIVIVSLVIFMLLYLMTGLYGVLFLGFAGIIITILYYYTRNNYPHLFIFSFLGKKHKTSLKKNKKTKEKSELKITFENVAGIDEIKADLEQIVDFLKNPPKYTTIGARIPKGILLVGPPGVGKTLLAKAMANEAGVNLISQGGSSFVEKYVGVGASNIRDLFSRAKSSLPCIIFIDEIDAIGKRSNDVQSSGDREYDQTINALLEEMDGYRELDGVIILGATNRLDKLDEALRRPGRFDRIIFVNKPDIKGRLAILKVHTKIMALAPELDLEHVAKSLPGTSGADLANIANEAAIRAASLGKKNIDMGDFNFAKEQITIGRENKSLSSVLDDKEKTVIAIHESGHALVAHFTPFGEPIDKISIIPRGNTLGITSLIPEKDRYNQSREYLLDNIATLLGGRMAEKIKLGTTTIGAKDDLERAWIIATAMVCELGMGRSCGSSIFFIQDKNNTVLRPSQKFLEKIDNDKTELIQEAEEKAKNILEEKKDLLDKLSNELLARETLVNKEIVEILGEPTTPSS